ncbi:hypothetical protein, partial [Eggerthella sinensis]|uniref:hypothetical protein n=1 Tax=Eggerthella sinensis TaxID=242230 RepID=UPI0022E29F7C
MLRFEPRPLRRIGGGEQLANVGCGPAYVATFERFIRASGACPTSTSRSNCTVPLTVPPSR